MTDQDRYKAAFDEIVNNPPSVEDFLHYAEKAAQDGYPLRAILLICKAVRRITEEVK